MCDTSQSYTLGGDRANASPHLREQTDISPHSGTGPSPHTGGRAPSCSVPGLSTFYRLVTLGMVRSRFDPVSVVRRSASSCRPAADGIPPAAEAGDGQAEQSHRKSSSLAGSLQVHGRACSTAPAQLHLASEKTKFSINHQ